MIQVEVAQPSDLEAVVETLTAVRRKSGGQGLGNYLLHWAEGVARSEGKRFLRLDCWAENPVLVRYYREAGFNCRGEVQIGTWRGCLYERALD